MQALTAALAETQRRLTSITREIPHELSYRIIGRWAVDSASSANSWTPAIGDPVAENVDTTGGDISPVLARVDAVTSQLEPGDTFSLGNGKKYARRLEYRGWSQRHMPNGAVRITAAEGQSIGDDAVARARRGG